MAKENMQENLEKRTEYKSLARRLLRHFAINPRSYYGVGKCIGAIVFIRDQPLLGTYLAMSSVNELFAACLPHMYRISRPQQQYLQFQREIIDKEEERWKELVSGPLPIEFCYLKWAYSQLKNRKVMNRK